MYRQVELGKADRDFHRIVWRFTAYGPVEFSRMTRVTNGVEIPHRIVQTGLPENIPIFGKYPLLTGAISTDEARILQKQLEGTLK